MSIFESRPEKRIATEHVTDRPTYIGTDEAGGVAEIAETFERVRAKREKYEDRAEQIKSMVGE